MLNYPDLMISWSNFQGGSYGGVRFCSASMVPAEARGTRARRTCRRFHRNRLDFQENTVKKWNFQGKIGVMGNMRAFGVLWDIKSLNNEETWHFQSGQMMTNVCFQTGTLKQEIYMVTPANMLISFWKMRNLHILATRTGSFF